MFSKSFSTATALLVLASLALNVAGQTIITPAIGVKGAAKQADVQQASNRSPCGNINIASAVAASTAVTASAKGTFGVTVQNFVKCV